MNACFGHGLNNRFLLVDFLRKPPQISPESYTKLHQSVLATGVDDALIIEYHGINYDTISVKMHVLEPDGSFADFCGNGARVVGKYLNTYYPCHSFQIKSRSNLHSLTIVDENLVSVSMGAVTFQDKDNLYIQKQELFDNKDGYMCSDKILPNMTVYYSETVEPHLIIMDRISEDDLERFGKFLNEERRDIFPRGINLNRISVESLDTFAIKTYERGVNKITQACGTGSTSCAGFLRRLSFLKTDKIIAKNSGGSVEITFVGDKVFMTGPAWIDQETKICPV